MRLFTVFSEFILTRDIKMEKRHGSFQEKTK